MSKSRPMQRASSPPVVTLSREEMRTRALAFAKRWAGPQREESEAKTFLDEFFEVFGRDRRAVDARHEFRVEREGQAEARIDLLWPGKLLVEMKTTGRDLSEAKNGAARQAFDYLDHLEPEDRPRWVLVSDFAHFVLYDLGPEIHDYLRGLASARRARPEIAAQFPLADLPDRLRHFAFIRDEEQQLFQIQPDVNLKAVALLGDLHDELKKSGYAGHRLERFLVRVLFCLFAEDTDIFEWESFTRFVRRSKKDGSDLGQRLAKLFEVLDQDASTRSAHLPPEFAAFPYINGGLFAERLDTADLTTEHLAALRQCCTFDWSKISPGVFGSLFQGVMDKRERRAKGAHYTSEENIRRVLDPLCLDELRAEFKKAAAQTGNHKPAADGPKFKTTRQGLAPAPRPRTPLEVFHGKLAELRFLDPACGCGNFLVVAYRELRRLELEVLQAQFGDQLPIGLNVGDLVRLNVDQFYGIELEEFPALIAETALWLTDHQVNMEFSKAYGQHYARIPLKKSATIVCGNALRLDWSAILPPARCSYVLGNPPFIGKQLMSASQTADMEAIWGAVKGYGVLDYVTCWYLVAARYMLNTRIVAAFVSTNSISQGEQPGFLWSHLHSGYHARIHFAHRTFTWTNEAAGKAHVHVVIVGFALFEAEKKRLYCYSSTGEQTAECGTAGINAYLAVGPEIFIQKRREPLGAAEPMQYGSKPVDGGHLLLTPDERSALLQRDPAIKNFVRPFRGSEEFINGIDRYCLWLADSPPQTWRGIPAIMERVEAVQTFRLASKKAKTVEQAASPALFGELRQPTNDYLAVPEVSSENRRYIPIAILPATTIASNLLYTVPGASKLTFGLLTSTMHMTWMRTVAGRLKSDYRYSAGLVYNTFPWPEPDTKQRDAIEQAAQAVLDARAPRLAAGASLADLYDPLAMPAELLKAHQALDRAVDRAYRPAPFTSERERVEFLFALYEKLTAPLAPAAKPTKRPRVKKPAAYPEASGGLGYDAHLMAQEDPPAAS